jgi:KDO2-lipid IV(A) lauroyltransferase
MPRRRSRLFDFGVYLAVRVLVCVIQAMSWPAALGFAQLFAWVARGVNRRHRRVAEENLRHAFPHLEPATVRRLVAATYLHLVLVLVEIIRLPRLLHPSNAGTFIGYEPPEDYDRALSWVKSRRPLLILTGHFGNWEILCYVTGLLGFRGSVVARRLDNPFLDSFLRGFRRKTGQQLLDKSGDYYRIQEVLARGGTLGMLGDQDAGSRGLFVDFLGRPASTFKSIALLSLAYQAPILIFGAARVGHPIKYRVYLEDVIVPEDYSHAPDAPRAITQRYTAALERMVRRHPEQYFWLHRRWKSQAPAPRTKRAA